MHNTVGDLVISAISSLLSVIAQCTCVSLRNILGKLSQILLAYSDYIIEG